MPPTELEFGGSARAYLEHIVRRVRERFAQAPRREQLSVWMVPTGPGTASGKEFRREVIDKDQIDFYCQDLMRDGSSEQTRLTDLLVEMGVHKNETLYSFLLPLLRHWLDSADPLNPSEGEFHLILAELNRAVFERRILARRVDALELTDPIQEEIRLDDNVTVRRISTEELWDLGDQSSGAWRHFGSRHLAPFLSEDLAVVEITVLRDARYGDQGSEVNTLGEAVSVALRVLAPGVFRVMSLGQWTNYGYSALGRMFQGDGLPQRQGLGGGAYALDTMRIARLRTIWADLRRIVESEQHYLRLPALKLLEGGRRARNDDAIIDYSIALEALLLSGLRQELSYRFALRGSTIRSLRGGVRKDHFEALKELYGVRSRIVHGDRVANEAQAAARASGEEALREIWWWFYENARESHDSGIDLVEQRIVS